MRLLADDALADDLLLLAVRVGDDPVPGQELRGGLALVRDPDRVREEPAAGGGLGPVGTVLAPHLDADALGHGARHGRTI